MTHRAFPMWAFMWVTGLCCIAATPSSMLISTQATGSPISTPTADRSTTVRRWIAINMVSYGGGANSTALLIGLHQHRIPVDLILFADTGAEHPHTYAYLDVMDSWLKDHGMPKITRVY